MSGATRSRHDGDCTIYSALINGYLWDGICTCGYGLDVMRSGGEFISAMLSEERINSLPEPDVSNDEFGKLVKKWIDERKAVSHEREGE